MTDELICKQDATFQCTPALLCIRGIIVVKQMIGHTVDYSLAETSAHYCVCTVAFTFFELVAFQDGVNIYALNHFGAGLLARCTCYNIRVCFLLLNDPSASRSQGQPLGVDALQCPTQDVGHVGYGIQLVSDVCLRDLSC